MRELETHNGLFRAISPVNVAGMSYAKHVTMKTHLSFTRRIDVAFTLPELMVVLGVCVLLFLLLIPRHTGNRAKATTINCVCNLKQVGLSFRIWGGDHGEKYPMLTAATNGGPFQQVAISGGTGAAYTYQIFQVLSNELGTPKIVLCPSDGDRNFAKNFGGYFTALSNSAISYFVGKDTDETNPQQYLAGDRNIGVKPANGWSGNNPDGGVTGFSPNSGATGSYRSLAAYAKDMRLQWTDKLHQAKGNVCLADGSVQQYTSAKMRAGITNAGDAAWTYFP